jgi:hypothetical protein
MFKEMINVKKTVAFMKVSKTPIVQFQTKIKSLALDHPQC